MKDEKKTQTEGLMKISELARRTETSVSTLKYYIKEGLIGPALKTGRNMSWYDPSCVETVKRIKKLQRERYYPLHVIKEILRSNITEQPPEMELLNAISKMDPQEEPGKYSLKEVASESGLSQDQIRMMAEAGIISGTARKKDRVFTLADVQVMKLAAQRQEAGIPFDQTLHSFRVYDGSLYNAAENNIDSFVKHVVMDPDLTTDEGVRRIHVSDETLESFISIRRKEYNRRYGARYLDVLFRFSEKREQVLEKLTAIMHEYGYDELASFCAGASEGKLTGNSTLDECLQMFTGRTEDDREDIMHKISICAQGREFFCEKISRADQECGTSGLLLSILQYCWLKISPDILGCRDAAVTAESEMSALMKKTDPEKYMDICSAIIEACR